MDKNLSKAEAELISKVAMSKIFERNMPVVLELDAAMTLSIISQLQLAFRHPQNTGPSREMVEKFIRYVIDKLDPEKGEIYQFFVMGFDKNYDVVMCRNCGTDVLSKETHCSYCNEQICGSCGCTDSAACAEGCYWMPSGICSVCVEKMGANFIDS